jgi:ABC-type phosphate/phosphonate transport system ATPase subunit
MKESLNYLNVGNFRQIHKIEVLKNEGRQRVHITRALGKNFRSYKAHPLYSLFPEGATSVIETLRGHQVWRWACYRLFKTIQNELFLNG